MLLIEIIAAYFENTRPLYGETFLYIIAYSSTILDCVSWMKLMANFTHQMLFNIKSNGVHRLWSSYDGDYEECSLLGCDAVWVLLEPTSRSKEAMHTSETSVLTRSTQLHIPEDGIVQLVFSQDYAVWGSVKFLLALAIKYLDSIFSEIHDRNCIPS
jgi:hypothetical protein